MDFKIQININKYYIVKIKLIPKFISCQRQKFQTKIDQFNGQRTQVQNKNKKQTLKFVH